MAVYKRGKSYWVRFQWNGQEVRRPAKTASKAEALTFERELRAEFGRVYRGGKPRHSYNDAMMRFIKEYLPQLKQTSQTRYLVSARALHNHFEPLYLDQINKGVLAEFVAYRKLNGVGAAGIRRDLACLSSMLSAAVRWDWIDNNPVKGMDKRDIKEPTGRLRFLTQKEFNEVCGHAPTHLFPLIQFAVETGLRFGEQFGLTWAQVDMKRGEIRLSVTKSGTPRSVPLSATAKKILEDLPRHFKEPYVFWHEDGQRYQVLRRSFQTALKKAGIKDFTWHDLRHTFASWQIQKGMDLYSLQRILGHADPKMTQRYAHLRTQDLHKALKRTGTKTGTRSRD